MPSNDELDRSIGERLKTARLRRHMTLAALAADLGLTYQQVHKYETGRNRISASTLFKAADTLGVDLTFFYSGCNSAAQTTESKTATTQGSDAELQAALLRVQNDEVRAKLAGLLDALVDRPTVRPRR